MKRFLDYIPPIIAFFAVVMGVSTQPKWDLTNEHLTPFGWVTVILGVVAMVTAMLLANVRHKELDLKTRQRELLREIAHAEVRLAVRQVTWPFFVLFGDESEESYLELVPAHIEDAATLESVLGIDVRSKEPPHATAGNFGIPWSDLLKRNADNGVVRIDRALQIYAHYLEPAVLERLSELRSSEFLVMRLQRLDEHVLDNTHVKFLPFPFPGYRDGEDIDFYGYGQFWRNVRQLDTLLTRDAARLRRRL